MNKHLNDLIELNDALRLLQIKIEVELAKIDEIRWMLSKQISHYPIGKGRFKGRKK